MGQGRLSPSEIYRGRSLFLLGSTGFLGKVVLSMLLYHFPSIRRIYVMVRAGSGTGSEKRFWDDVASSPVFDPLRECWGEAFEDFLRERVVVVGGDITSADLGCEPSRAQEIADDIDVVLNCAGRVTFNPALDQSLRTNVDGTRQVIAFTKRMKRPALVHVSTCFVTGNRQGEVSESEPLLGYYPKRGELGVELDVEQEIADAQRMIAAVKAEAQDALLGAEFHAAAKKRLREEGRDPENQRYLRVAMAQERKQWIRKRLTDEGTARAARWGWPNIYCYAKALGDQLVARERDMVRTIVRPSIVESAQHFPFPGWNEGFTTTAPLVFLALNGQQLFLGSDDLILDIVPVDSIAGGVIAVAAQACVEQPRLVHQLCSGDRNPSRMKRILTLTGLAKRENLRDKAKGKNPLLNRFLAHGEAFPVSHEKFERSSLPMFNRVAKKTVQALEQVRPRWGGARVADMIDVAKRKVERVEQVTADMLDLFELYRPFTLHNHYVFRADNLRALLQRIPNEERPLVPWHVDSIDWYDYWLKVHVPGMKKWIFPEIEKQFAAKTKSAFTYNSLLELFETSANLHATRVAFRVERDGAREQFTYARVQEMASRIAAALVQRGVQSGDRVALLSENCPEWPISYFGVLKAGATCVPIDRELSLPEIVNLVRSARAKGVVVSAALANKHERLGQWLSQLEKPACVWSFGELLSLPASEGEFAQERRALAALPQRPVSDSVASLIYTSGTTSQPKGVLLTHKNFTHVVSQLASVFNVTPRDGLLSVLPLHHTLEFSTGLLLPLSRGAQITYLDEVNAEAIGKALDRGETTAIVGVPALWTLFQRKTEQTLRTKLGRFSPAASAFVRAMSWFRERWQLNFGPLIFFPVHRKFGGRIRYLISGGSALSPETLRNFHGLGFSLLEGYGLTEAAPVLTVTPPGLPLRPGSVGRALPSVELRIDQPDADGVGEIIARGHNVMQGYDRDPDATSEVIQQRWLHTGDLGYLDEQRNLYIVGRQKDVIVTAQGKNVYPDELEDRYGASPLIEQICIAGLRDGTTERVAALVVGKDESQPGVSRKELHERIRNHVREVSQSLPLYQRIKVLHFREGPLPQTSTRKIKRAEVARELERLERVSQVAVAAHDATPDDDAAWLVELICSLSGRSKRDVQGQTRLSDLGFDSLMSHELLTAIEATGQVVPSIEDLIHAVAIDDVAQLVRNAGKKEIEMRENTDPVELPFAVDAEIDVPRPLAMAGARVLGVGQRFLYDQILTCRYEGQEHIPYHTNFIVAPNHCSHLDIGLAKMALKEAGNRLSALAAADYFYDSRIKRAYFNHFTNLIPMERSGSMRRSLRLAEEALSRGRNLLVFAEGTRSLSGEVQPFRASLGFLALQGGVGILPLHLRGTHGVFPKGARMLQGRDVGVRVGRLLTAEFLQDLAEAVPQSERNRFVSRVAEWHVTDLRDQESPSFDKAELLKRWQAESPILSVEETPHQRWQPGSGTSLAGATPWAAKPV